MVAVFMIYSYKNIIATSEKPNKTEFNSLPGRNLKIDIYIYLYIYILRI